MEFVSKQLIDRGWSADKKYCAVTSDGERYLLRVASEDKREKFAALFEMQRRVDRLGVPTCTPVEFGSCDRGVYTVYRWVDGDDANEVLPGLPLSEQYDYGVESGRLLRIIHSIPAPVTQPDWETRFNTKIDRKIAQYGDCPIKFDGAEQIIEYIDAHRKLLCDRPQCFQHGDYHTGNMMFERGKLVIIDFDRYDFGDPWEEFNRIVWCAQLSPHFASGMVDGYFDGEPPEMFWELLALYIGSNTLSSVPWAIDFGGEQVDIILNQTRDLLGWYDKMRRTVPAWYTK